MIYSRKTFHIPIYASKVTVLVVDKCDEEYNKIAKKLGEPESPPDPTVLAYACWFDKKIGQYYLLFSTRKPLTLPIIAHECFHLTLAICSHFGVTISGEEEAPAYLFEHLFTQVAQYLMGPLHDKDIKLQVQPRKPRRSPGKNNNVGGDAGSLPSGGQESQVALPGVPIIG